MVKELKDKIKALTDQITSIQEQCSHPQLCVTETYGADRGNYCPSDDCYWTNFHCSLCDKHWRVVHGK